MEREKIERKDLLKGKGPHNGSYKFYLVNVDANDIDNCFVKRIYSTERPIGTEYIYFYEFEKETAFEFLRTYIRSIYNRFETIDGSKFDRTGLGKPIKEYPHKNLTYVDSECETDIQQLTINQIAEAVHSLAKEKGWHDEAETVDHFIERMCNNAHDEVSELHQAWRDNKLYLPCDKAAKMKELNLKPLTCLEEEMADIIIRALDACMKLKLNPQDIIARKHIFNTTRPHRHGGKRS